MDWHLNGGVYFFDSQYNHHGVKKIMKNKLKVYRAIHDLTQDGLAKKIGVARATVNAIEKGKYDPSLKLAFKMARFFEVNVEELFVYNEQE